MDSVDQAPPRAALRRRLSAVLLVIAAVCLTLASVAAWTRSSLLDTDRYVAIVTAVGADEQVIALASDRLATQIVVAVDVQGRVEAALPERAGFLAVPLTERIQAGAARALTRALSSEQFQTVWAGANRRAHTQFVALMRGETSNVTLEGTVLTLDLFPIVVSGIADLQASGVIPAAVPLPDLRTEEDLEAARQRLGTALGVPIPADLGVIQIADSAALARIATVVRVLDAAVFWLLAAAAAAAVGAVVLSLRRARTVVWLGLVSIGLLVVVKVVIGAATGILVDAVQNPEAGATLGSLLGRLQDDLYRWLAAIMLGTALVASVAWLVHIKPWRWAPPSPEDLRSLALLAVGLGLVWAIVGRDAALLVALVMAGVSLWATRRHPSVPMSTSTPSAQPPVTGSAPPSGAEPSGAPSASS
jgi:hypothetical protein